MNEYIKSWMKFSKTKQYDYGRKIKYSKYTER